MGIEQKQIFRVNCDRTDCNSSVEYEVWIEKINIDDNLFQNLPKGWEYIYSFDWGGTGVYCPVCINQLREKEQTEKEKAEKNRAKNLRKMEKRYGKMNKLL